MDIKIVTAEPTHGPSITALFNYYVANSYAAFPVEPVNEGFYHRLREQCDGLPFYVGLEGSQGVVAFAFLRRFYPSASFKPSAEVGIFIHPDYRGKGLGTRLSERLEAEARRLGVETLLAKISSFNEESLGFHSHRGFVRAGELKDIAEKAGRRFSVIWMQKWLEG